jgi:hypothetical protein
MDMSKKQVIPPRMFFKGSGTKVEGATEQKGNFLMGNMGKSPPMPKGKPGALKGFGAAGKPKGPF